MDWHNLSQTIKGLNTKTCVMDDFAQIPIEESTTYFEQAAAELNLTPIVIEKDFWVCWTLRRLFETDDFNEHLTFKGGTSLSKVFNVIERFSEDIDISIDRAFLGFTEDKDPEKATSNKQAQRLIAELQDTCRQRIIQELEPNLQENLTKHLAREAIWQLRFDDQNPQTLLFNYPSTTTAHEYILPQIKIEFGARSDHFPTEHAQVSPYLYDALPESMQNPATTIKVLSAERTFWEKATILHSLFHLDANKRIPARMSRHYYDFYQLSNSDVFTKALDRIDLLKRVAIHKSIFFKSAWAKYEEAKPGSLQLSPPQSRLQELSEDYRAMQPMFFKEPASLPEIVKRIEQVQNQINKQS